MGGGTLKHLLTPDWLRKKYYTYLSKKEYERVKRLPENKYEEYLVERYAHMMDRFEYTRGMRMDFENPVTYTQKQQWLKLYDQAEEKTRYSDKYAVREHIKNTIGEEYLIPLIAIDGKDHFYDADEIDFDKLPNQFVLKCNHGSHYNIVVKDKQSLSDKRIKQIKKQMNKWLKEDYTFKVGLELLYKDIIPCIIIEKYVAVDDDLPDYKFYCFNGEIKFWLCIQNRYGDLKQSYYDLNWELVPFMMPTNGTLTHDNVLIQKPQNFDKMVEIARILSANFIHVRVDLYNVEGKVFFGELTFSSAAGYDVASPVEYDKVIGDWIAIDKKKRDTNRRYR